MRNLLALVAFLVLLFAAVGWYRDWYRVQSEGSEVHITIHKDRVGSDVRKSEERVHEVITSPDGSKE